jgi:hypothetical protein
MIAFIREEDLSFLGKPAERGRMDDTIAVAWEFGSHGTGAFRDKAAATFRGNGGTTHHCALIAELWRIGLDVCGGSSVQQVAHQAISQLVLRLGPL